MADIRVHRRPYIENRLYLPGSLTHGWCTPILSQTVNELSPPKDPEPNDGDLRHSGAGQCSSAFDATRTHANSNNGRKSFNDSIITSLAGRRCRAHGLTMNHKQCALQLVSYLHMSNPNPGDAKSHRRAYIILIEILIRFCA